MHTVERNAVFVCMSAVKTRESEQNQCVKKLNHEKMLGKTENQLQITRFQLPKHKDIKFNQTDQYNSSLLAWRSLQAVFSNDFQHFDSEMRLRKSETAEFRRAVSEGGIKKVTTGMR